MNKFIKSVFALFVMCILILTGYFVLKGKLPFEKGPEYIMVEQGPQLLAISGEEIMKENLSVDVYKDAVTGEFYYEPESLEPYFSYKYEYDKRHDTVIFATRQSVYRFNLSSQQYTINNKPYKGGDPIRIIDEKPLLNMTMFSEEIGMALSIDKDNETLLLKDLSKDIKLGRIEDKVFIRKSLPLAQPEQSVELVGKLKASEKNSIQLMLGKEIAGYREVITEEGLSGYIEASYIVDEKVIESSIHYESIKALQGKSDKIFLGWDNEPGKGPIKDLEHINILSPTWYSLSSDSEIKSIRKEAYRNWVYEEGIELWPLFSNSFDLERTHAMLVDSQNRKAVIDTLVEVYSSNNYHGINIDFENVYLEDKDLLVQFVAELVPRFHEYDMVVSIDITVEGGSDTWSRFLDRKALGELVDYVAVMTYDEHWKSSPISGPVASLDWVDKHMGKLSKKIDPEKLILGIPFYIRVWQESPSGSKKVKARDLYMTSATKIIEENGLVPTWDEENGQNYVSYVKDDIVYKIWLEDAKSIKLKTELVKKYNLAGSAGWSVRFTNNDIFKLIDNIMND